MLELPPRPVDEGRLRPNLVSLRVAPAERTPTMNRIDPTVEAPSILATAGGLALEDATPTLVIAGPAHEASRALVVADDPLVRQSLQVRLGPIAAGEATCSDDLALALTRTDANVVLFDLGPDAANEGELTSQVSALPVPVVALAPAGLARVALLGAGVAGVIGREVDGLALGSALAAVRQGLRVTDRAAIDELDRPAPTEVLGARVDGLTHREHEVVQLMAEGLSNKQIADRLGISAHTAKFHVNAVLGKLHASTRTEAVVRAVQRGVVML